MELDIPYFWGKDLLSVRAGPCPGSESEPFVPEIGHVEPCEFDVRLSDVNFSSGNYKNGANELQEHIDNDSFTSGEPNTGRFARYRTTWKDQTGYILRNDSVTTWKLKSFYRTDGVLGNPFMAIKKLPDIGGGQKEDGQMVPLTSGVYFFNNSGKIAAYNDTTNVWQTGGPSGASFRSVQDSSVEGFDDQRNSLLVASDGDRIAYLSFDYSNKAFIKFNETDLTFTNIGGEAKWKPVRHGSLLNITMAIGFPPIPVYPLGIDSDATLYKVYNTAEARLSANNVPWAEEIEIEPVGADEPEIWANNGFANIDGEMFYYDAVGKSGTGKVNKLKRCARNIGGTKTHFNAAGTWVRGFVVAEHHNQLVDAVLAIETFLGAGCVDGDDTSLSCRIERLENEPECVDDHGCPDIKFTFDIQDSSNCEGTVATYSIAISGSFNRITVDFGDGNTTTTLSGTHTYSPNAKIDPVVTVANDSCQIIQTPSSRSEPEEPAQLPSEVPFEIPVPTIPPFPTIIIPDFNPPSTTLTLPQIVFPCLDVGPLSIVVPSVINVIPPFNIPSVIVFTSVEIPSIISFGNIPSFTPIDISFSGNNISFTGGDVSFTGGNISFTGGNVSFTGGAISISGGTVSVTWGIPPTIPPISFGTFPTIPPLSVNAATFPPLSITATSIPPLSITATSLPPLSITATSIPPLSFNALTLPPISFNALTLPPISFNALTLPPLSITATSIPPLSFNALTLPPISLRRIDTAEDFIR
jgi:hypothetical protein